MSDASDHLRIVLSQRVEPPTPRHELLIAFRFGSDDGVYHPAVVDTGLIPVDGGSLYECWWIAEPVSHRHHGAVRIAECKDYAVLVLDKTETDTDELVTLTQVAYREILHALRTTVNGQLAKVWNYLGGINRGDGDDERYRQFSAGRAAAFDAFELADDAAPAGTGIGTIHDYGLTIIALATNNLLHLTDNPRQLSAFRYPRRYGPSSPKFARGGTVSGDRHTLHLLSGTAAIVGHESVHPNEIRAQLDETIRNISALSEPLSVLEGDCIFRVYLRNPDDIGPVARHLISQLNLKAEQIAFLAGHICRRELLIEIDGVRVQARSSTATKN